MDLVQQVIALTNNERAKHGLRALQWNEQLFKAAQGHSQNMAHGDFFEHGDPVKRAKEQDIHLLLLERILQQADLHQKV